MVYLLALHSSALHTSTMKFRQDFIGPLFIDTALDEMHYRLKDATGLLLNGMYHMNRIKKGSARTLQGIVTTFDDYEKTLNPFPAVHRNNCSCNISCESCTLITPMCYPAPVWIIDFLHVYISIIAAAKLVASSPLCIDPLCMLSFVLFCNTHVKIVKFF